MAPSGSRKPRNANGSSGGTAARSAVAAAEMLAENGGPKVSVLMEIWAISAVGDSQVWNAAVACVNLLGICCAPIWATAITAAAC